MIPAGINQHIPNWLIKRAYLTPKRTAVFYHGEAITFQQLYEQAMTLANKLASLNCQKGQKIAVLLKNHYDSILLLHSLQLLGNIAVILNNRLTENELIFQLKDSEAELLIADQAFTEKCQNIHHEMPELHIEYLQELHKREEKPFAIVEEFQQNEVCTIMYTSGTTGFPKGVMQTYGNHWWSAIGSLLNLGLIEQDAWVLAVPIYHISGFSILIRSVVYGIPIILYEKFDPISINQDLIAGKASIISVVPTMLVNMLENLGDRTYHERLRCVLLGGGPAPVSLLEKCKEKGIPVFQTYGMTETSSQIVTLAPEDSLIKIGSAGKPLFPNQLQILSVNNKTAFAKANEIGEIIVKGPTVTKGYYKRDEANKKSFLEGGWFRTGDLGYVDEEGYLFVVDRRQDLIISGGENIYPAEIENVLHSHPAIKEAAIIGIEDEKWGQVPCAFYVLKEGKNVLPSDLEAFCKNYLATYKVPKKWINIDQLPRNATNKVMRRVLKEMVNTGQTQD